MVKVKLNTKQAGVQFKRSVKIAFIKFLVSIDKRASFDKEDLKNIFDGLNKTFAATDDMINTFTINGKN